MRTSETGKRLWFLSILIASMRVVIQIWKNICVINVEDWRIKKNGFSSLLYLHWWKFYFKNIFENKLFEKCPCSELFWSAFSRIWTEYEEILCISPYSVQMRENADQNNSEYAHFLRSGRRTLRTTRMKKYLSSAYIIWINKN